MNVRFFAGTRAQYDSLPSPRNPLGLYFCEDTQELFWADRLLTDGMRVVATQADLPDPARAADGVVYYVTETRNGYVVPHGTTKWLQTIYAPALDADHVPEDEIYNTVTTVGAVRDIEAKIYDAINILDRRVANIEINGGNGSGGGTNIDGCVKSIYFAGYELEEVEGHFVIDRRCAREALGLEVPDGLEDKEIEILTKEYLEERLSKIPGTDLDLTRYYTKEEIDGLIPDTSTFVTKAELPSVEGLASEEFVIKKIAEAELADQDIDLSAYYTKSETDIAINAAINAIEIPEAELYKVDFNAPDFVSALEAYNNGKLLLLVNAAPDTNGYAVMNYVRADLITFTKFLTSRSEAYGSFNTYYLHSDNTWEVSKEVKLNKVEANVADEPTAELTSLRVGKEVYKLPDLANYVTNEVLEQNYITQEEIANTYVTEEHISSTYVTIQNAEDTYVTNETVTEVVTNEVNTVVTERIEDKVTEVIEKKMESGNIVVNQDSINYDTWDEEW